ncbi:MAG: hypothetical protein OXF50_16920 [Caldilineaceae bacterium]|nr:hypothetical protein [Caldilineaceae bacterium]
MSGELEVQRNEAKGRVESERLDPHEVLRALITLYRDNLFFPSSMDQHQKVIWAEKILKERDQKKSEGRLDMP